MAVNEAVPPRKRQHESCPQLYDLPNVSKQAITMFYADSIKKDTPKLLFSNVRSLCHQSDLPCSLENSISQARTARLYTYNETQSILVSSIDTHQVQLLKYSTAQSTAQSIFILVVIYLGKWQTGKNFLFGSQLQVIFNRQTQEKNVVLVQYKGILCTSF